MPVIKELFDLILVALVDKSDAKPDPFDNYPVDEKRHLVVGGKYHRVYDILEIC